MNAARKLAAMALAAGLGIAGLVAGAPSANAVEHPTLVARVPSQNYGTLYWDACTSSTGAYWFLEGRGSVCGVGNAGDFFSFAFVSFVNNGQRNLEVCHSGNHSGTTTLYDYDTTGRERHLADSGGGGCALATRTNMVDWLSNWGGEDSPLQTAP
jgi:hypothetical protein